MSALHVGFHKPHNHQNRYFLLFAGRSGQQYSGDCSDCSDYAVVSVENAERAAAW